MDIRQALRDRILILDGAMGTMLQRRGIIGGDNELLNLTNPEAILDIHREYIAAGADIIETNSFGANRISQAEYGHAGDAGKMAYEAARIARMAADEAARHTLGKQGSGKVWVAGSVGPTGKSLTMASDADRPEFREVDFEIMTEVCREQILALAEGGADLILLETCFDALNAKAALKAMEGLGVPVIISATVSDRSGRTLTGQTLESFYHSIGHAEGLVAFGTNCALGAAAMEGLVRDIDAFSSVPLIFYPNAGIPDEFGRYCDSPAAISAVMRKLGQDGLLNIAGGCCGTTPEHIRAVAEALEGLKPRTPRADDGRLSVCGLDTVTIDRSLNFTNIGERTNVAGSRRFAKLIAAGDYDAALEVAAAQVEGGAGIIDINMDDPMLDRTSCMRDFLRHISADPCVAKAAIMIDSSDWPTVLEGLRNAQGKSIVNSISLKDGEEQFLRKAREIRSYGAAMVVMAFDEQGQAETFDRKVEICSRSFRLLCSAGIEARDIIFDCNILTIGTGIPEHARFGVDFIEAVRWIKNNLKGALTSGGVSNLSFAFRGNNAVREAMHSVFLYHAIRAGLDMAIVNPQMLRIYDDVEPQLRTCIEDVIFDRDPSATARLVQMASSVLSPAADTTPAQDAAPSDALSCLREAVIKGNAANIREDALSCLSILGDAVSVIEGPLMGAMETVGELFADGKMFLPQVVKSAKMMREAISELTPYMKETRGKGSRPVFVIATVQGDVHDIGKKITASILLCSGFEVHDLGVMVPCSEILQKASELHADIIGVSGLITPSLSRMEELCREMRARGMSTPLFVGGAAASAMHTALRLAPLYDHVHYGSDASTTAVMAKRYMQSPSAFMQEESEKRSKLLSLCPKPAGGPVSPRRKFLTGRVFDDVPLTEMASEDLLPYFDWKMFSAVCGVKDVSQVREEALRLLGRMSVRLCAGFPDCHREGDVLVVDNRRLDVGKSLADFYPPYGNSQLGLFAVRADLGGCEPDDLIAHAACVTLAEAGSSYLGSVFSKRLEAMQGEGYVELKDEACGGRRGEGCREPHSEDSNVLIPGGLKVFLPAVGYPICPDHSLKKDILALLPPGLGISLTESLSMIPEASICGFVVTG